MNFNLDEYGGKLYANFRQDISTGTSLTIELEPQRGELKEFTSNVVVGSSNVTIDDESMVANEYLEYTIQETDLDQAGQWRVRGSVIVSGELIKTDYVRFTVLD